MSVVLETWRTKKVTIPSATETIITLDPIIYKGISVVPNVIQIRNYNTSEILYVDIKSGVGSTQYISSISPQNVSVHVATGNYNTYYLYIAGEAIIDLNYAYDPEPLVSDLDQTQITNIINTTLTIASVAISSIAAGTNNIGKVDIASIAAGTNNIGDVDVLSLPPLPAGTNNIGDVDVLSLPALPAGSNLIGKAEIVDTANKLKVEADGSINVNGATFSGTIGTVKLEDETGTYFLLIDSSGHITSKLSGAIPAGDNNIGNIDVVTIPDAQINKPATTPAIYNITCTTLNTEYSQALTANCKKFIIGIQSKDDTVTWKLKFGTGGTAFHFNGSETYECNDLLLASQTLYFESNKSGEVIQIIEVV